ncbi:hypothetical protein D3C86_2033710 [compost metagenome]
MVLLIKTGAMQPDRVTGTLDATFDRRATHPLPTELQDPPEAWGQTFAPMASECALSETLSESIALVRGYYASLDVRA